jgi:hypothetical protein
LARTQGPGGAAASTFASRNFGCSDGSPVRRPACERSLCRSATPASAFRIWPGRHQGITPPINAPLREDLRPTNPREVACRVENRRSPKATAGVPPMVRTDPADWRQLSAPPDWPPPKGEEGWHELIAINISSGCGLRVALWTYRRGRPHRLHVHAQMDRVLCRRPELQCIALRHFQSTLAKELHQPSNRCCVSRRTGGLSRLRFGNSPAFAMLSTA